MLMDIRTILQNTKSSVHCVRQKCAEYWPEDTVTHEGIEITVVAVTQEDDYSLRLFTLKVRHRKRLLNDTDSGNTNVQIFQMAVCKTAHYNMCAVCKNFSKHVPFLICPAFVAQEDIFTLPNQHKCEKRLDEKVHSVIELRVFNHLSMLTY